MPPEDAGRLADRKYIVYDVLDRIAALEMRARSLVEGVLAGLQRSPYMGASSEFAQHRAYVPGDDVRHVDWRVYGRTERYYVRQFQEETNFVVTFLVDCSESMRFGTGEVTKLDHASLIVSSLAYLALRQSDAASLALFDESLLSFLPPRTGLGSLDPLAAQMETITPKRGGRLPEMMRLLAEMLQRRGIVVIVSDLLDTDDEGETGDASALARGIQLLRSRHHEVIVFQVLDTQELSFDFNQRTRFEGLEGLPSANAEPERLRADYLALMRDFLQATRSACVQARADYALAVTGEPVDQLLVRYLTSRGKVREGRR